MTPFVVRPVGDDERAALVGHFLALPMRDRCLRFGMSLAPTVIAAYVDRIDFTRDAMFGVCDDRYALVGAAHLSLDNGIAELALSVLPEYRARGMGSALFERSVTQARARGMREVLMRCLTGNTPVVRMARRFGMSIVSVGRVSDGCLALAPSLEAEQSSSSPLPLLPAALWNPEAESLEHEHRAQRQQPGAVAREAQAPRFRATGYADTPQTQA